jgi:hypothetical protein
MLIILQAINHFQEAILPLVIRKAYSTGTKILLKKYPKFSRLMTDEDDMGSKENNNSTNPTLVENSIWNPGTLGLQILDASDPRIEKSKIEGEMDPYEVS